MSDVTMLEKDPSAPADEPRKCRDLFRLYTDSELIVARRLENLQRRREALRAVLQEDYARENRELGVLGLCYGIA